jgi:hypothetical protein
MQNARTNAIRRLALAWLLAPLCFAQTSSQAPGGQDAGSASRPGQESGGPADAGRSQLNASLDRIASGYTAERAKAVAAIQSQSEAEARQEAVRKKLLALIGSLPKRTPLNARSLGETQAEGFRVRKVIFESQPNFYVTALLYLPGGPVAASKRAGLLMTPGHYPTGKAADARMAALFARNGFVVLSYDPIGQGERLQYPNPAHPGESLVTGATGEHAEASLQPMLIGDTFARYEIWDAMRGIDYLASSPEVDSKRIGAFGCSGGGTVTALTSALDPRIVATGVACYITSFDALLPTIGPQDAEQSSPLFISSGLDFADLLEVAAPRPYVVVSTYSDMFPFAGARASVTEARSFYALFDPASAGTPTGNLSTTFPPILTEPALNVDTANKVSRDARLQFITGPGHHAALTPILGPILSFFLHTLEPDAVADHPIVPASLMTATSEADSGVAGLPKEALQVTPTGQVATSYPDAATVFTLNRQRAAKILPVQRPTRSRDEVAQIIRAATGAQAMPGTSKPDALPAASGPCVLHSGDGVDVQADLAVPNAAGRHPAVLFLIPDSIHGENAIAQANRSRFEALAATGRIVLAITPRPSPPGTEGMKSPVLGPFYLLSLRADLVGRTLLGMRVDDVIHAMDDLAVRPDVDPARISAIASGPMGLVLLHAAVLDARIRHIAVDHVLTSYRSLLDSPLPGGAPEDIVPGVLLRYDIPELVRMLGSRVETHDPLNGTDDLSLTSLPIDSLRNGMDRDAATGIDLRFDPAHTTRRFDPRQRIPIRSTGGKFFLRKRKLSSAPVCLWGCSRRLCGRSGARRPAPFAPGADALPSDCAPPVACDRGWRDKSRDASPQIAEGRWPVLPFCGACRTSMKSPSPSLRQGSDSRKPGQ